VGVLILVLGLRKGAVLGLTRERPPLPKPGLVGWPVLGTRYLAAVLGSARAGAYSTDGGQDTAAV
jgi:hypothetical protein